MFFFFCRRVFPSLLHLVVVFRVLRLLVLAVLLLPLANLTDVSLLLVELGEDQVENFREPADRVPFNALLDILYNIVSNSINNKNVRNARV